ncbi:hypothetical protein H072_1850 [Dactylellina haptotyla CBS 200.50]|uniref:Phosphoglycerate mutase-like protein n=1 Tax=Dactylellina haptotyla (strain CBS 200.50) TaxID=1284197 RepID=S8AMQ7_DACHA|nr:hypothetical protein H072_1850 [Dactylellina haptotyla CBS 200.50]
MKILFIRHGETTDNLRHVYAGVTDSALTSHGVLQTARLATHLGTSIPPVTHIFCSPLSRATKTADAIYDEQKRLKIARRRAEEQTTTSGVPEAAAPDVPEAGSGGSAAATDNMPDASIERGQDGDYGIFFSVDQDLIEQDFGSYEGGTLLTVKPKKNVKKRKRSDSVSSASAVAEANTGDSKKRRADGEDTPVCTGAGPTSVPASASLATGAAPKDVEMTAGEEGPLTGSVDLQAVAEDAPKATESPEEEEEEEEEEFREMETPASIKARADSFIRRCIIPLLPGPPTLLPPSLRTPAGSMGDKAPPPQVESPVVAIVSHGMLLSWLWKSFASLFPPTSILATTPVVQKGWYQGKHPGWGNTGYLVVQVLPKGVVKEDEMTAVIEGVNEKPHLIGLRRTGGGVGSEKFDERQTKLEGFFGKKEA